MGPEQCSRSLLCEHKHISNLPALDLDGAWVIENLWGSYFVIILKESPSADVLYDVLAGRKQERYEIL